MNMITPGSRQFIVGLDVGGTKIQSAIAGLDGQVTSQVIEPMDSRDPQTVVESICRAIDANLAQAGLCADQLAIGQAGVPGQIEDGVVKYAVNLNLTAFPLAKELSQVYHIPFEIENDVRTAAMGAFAYYSMNYSLANLAYLSIGTGIAAGIVLGGQVYRGSNGMAGEIGHSIFDLDGPECRCGMHGCLETLSAGPALAAQAQQAIRAGEHTCLADLAVVESSAIYAAFRAGDALATRIVRQANRYLAQAVEWLMMAYDVDLLVLGGGVTHEGDSFLETLWQELDLIRAQSTFAQQMLDRSKIVLFPASLNAGISGSIAIAQACLVPLHSAG